MSHRQPSSPLPRCLRRRAPARYSILDEDMREVTPTLAGYALRPGKTYRLLVEAQDGQVEGWQLKLPPMARLIAALGDEEIQKNARSRSFALRRFASKGWTHIFRPSLMELAVKMDFEDDARQDYEFRIPVIQSSRAWYLALGIAVALVLTIVGEWVWNWAQTGSLTSRWTGDLLAITIGGAFVLAIGVWAWDLFRSYRRAKRFVQGLRPTVG